MTTVGRGRERKKKEMNVCADEKFLSAIVIVIFNVITSKTGDMVILLQINDNNCV